MFIHCGNGANGKVRVFDTRDRVTEEVDLIQLKLLQVQGYKVVTDFNYDYAYKFMNELESHGMLLYSITAMPMSNVNIDTMLSILSDINRDYKLCLGLRFGKRRECYASFKEGVIGIFTSKNRVSTLVASWSGIFSQSLVVDEVFPNSNPIVKMCILGDGEYVFLFDFYRNRIERYFRVSKFGEVIEENPAMYRRLFLSE